MKRFSVPLAKVEDSIVLETYWNTGKTTVCVLSLENGFEVVGSSSCVDVNLFDREKGMRHAREDAFRKVHMLEGYKLQEALYGKHASAGSVTTISRGVCSDDR